MTPLAVVVCTYDRSSDAIACLDLVMAQANGRRIPIILVDSASSTEHAAAIAEYAERHDNVDFLRSDVPGLSIARNLAVQHSDATWLAFLDDDARTSNDWWDTASSLAATATDDVSVIGGRILPRWPDRRPNHVGDRWLMFLSCIEEIEQDPANPLPNCYGANLMVRRSAVLREGGFPEELGRVGDTLLSGEEDLLKYRMYVSGSRVVYDGRLLVEHIIEPERLTVDWIRKRAFWGGVSEVVATQVAGTDATHLNPAKAVIAGAVLRLLAALGDRENDRLIRANYASGVFRAWWWSRASVSRIAVGSDGPHTVGARTTSTK